MKKNIGMILMVMILALTLFGCSNDNTSEKTNKTDGEEAVASSQNTEQTQATTPEAAKETTQTEASTESSTEETQATATLDSSLEGMALLNSLATNKPKSMKMVMETTAFGTKTLSTMYFDGDNSRTETVVEGIGTSVVINNAVEKVMYSYVEGSGQGVKITDADSESAEEAGLMMDMSTKLAELTDASSDAIIARVETLDGEEVVYIEATEADDEMGNILVKMWYSTKYSTPLKYEVIAGEQPMMSLKVIEIESNIKVDADMFEPASDIEFQEVNMEAMMDMMN